MKKNQNASGLLGGIQLGQKMSLHADAAAKTKVEEARSIQIVPIANILARHQEDTRPPLPSHILSLAESIAALGILQPLALDKKNRLIAGLHRLNAIRLLAAYDREDFFSKLGGKLSHEDAERLSELPQLSKLPSPLCQGEVPCCILDFDSANDTESALAAEAAENTARRAYSNEEIASIAQRLLNAGYSEREGRPRKGEKALRPTLEMILGMTSKQVRHALAKARENSAEQENLPKGQVFSSSKYLSQLGKISSKTLTGFEQLDESEQEKFKEIRQTLHTLREQLRQLLENSTH